MSDYVRQLPHQGSHDMARPPSAISRLHIDVPLLLLLLVLTLYGLVVLYSASGESMAAVTRQGRYFLVGYVILVVFGGGCTAGCGGPCGCGCQRGTALVGGWRVSISALGDYEAGGAPCCSRFPFRSVIAATILARDRGTATACSARRPDLATAGSGHRFVDCSQWVVRNVPRGHRLDLHIWCGSTGGGIGVAGLVVCAKRLSEAAYSNDDQSGD